MKKDIWSSYAFSYIISLKIHIFKKIWEIQMKKNMDPLMLFSVVISHFLNK